MLLEISIKNFAIIEEISLQFDNGMTVLTGETGAGKSIIIDAMNMMLGARASTEVIRHGAQKAEIEGFFSLGENQALQEVLQENGLELSDDLVIRREIFANGRSVSRINGQMVNLATLKQVGQFLVDIHGQHDQEDLMKASHHQAILDAFGDSHFKAVKLTYQELFDQYKSLRKKVIDKQKNERDHKERIDMLSFQMAEIEAADLKRGEDQALIKERDRLLNHKNIADTLTNAYVMLDNEEFSSLSNMRSAMNDLMSIEDYDPDYKTMSSSVSEAYYILEEVTKQLADTIDNLDFDGARLQEIEARLDIINSLSRKYGGQVDDILDYYNNSLKEYQLLSGGDVSTGDIEKALKQLEKDLLQAASDLSKHRHQLYSCNLRLTLKMNLKSFIWKKLILK